MHGVTDYMFSLPGGLLSRDYDIERCVDFLMERGRHYLNKILPRYNRQLVLDLVNYLVSVQSYFSVLIMGMFWNARDDSPFWVAVQCHQPVDRRQEPAGSRGTHEFI